jgi:arylsulfatase A-like enzyme
MVGTSGVVSRREALRLAALGLSIASTPLLGACAGDGAGSGRESPSAGGDTRADRGAGDRPNFLVIVADDMRYDQLRYMPNVQRLIQDAGTTFTQARCNVPLCQPSRVGFLTGQTSVHHRELGIGFAGSVFSDHDNALGRWMHDAGYRCGFFGKYVNGYNARGGIAPPAGYSVWRQVLTPDAEDGGFRVRDDSGVTTVGDEYSTDYLAREVTAFVRAEDEPFLCIVTPTQPHAPSVVPTDLADRWADVTWAIVDEADVSDKPPWIRELPPLDDDMRAQIVAEASGMLRELSAVDDMVDQIVGSMDAGVLDNTVVVFTSDNGVHLGEHRRPGPATKGGPYEVGLHVPLLVRGPGFEAGAEVTVPILMFPDVTATLCRLGGAEPGLPHQAGTSLDAIAGSPDDHASRVLLHAITAGYYGQSGDGITTGPDHPLGFRKLYRYPSAALAPDGPFTYEAYDLDDDPDEDHNWAEDPARRDERDALEAQLDAQLT